MLGCCEQLCVEAKPVLAYFRKPSFCPRLIQNLLHGSVSAPEACIWRRVLGVIKNQYFCRRNLRAAARATDRFTVRGPALLVTSGHLRPRYREISSSGAHRAEISTSSGPRTFWRGSLKKFWLSQSLWNAPDRTNRRPTRAPAGDFEASIIRREASGGFFQASCARGAASHHLESPSLSNYITGPTSEPDAQRRRPEE